MTDVSIIIPLYNSESTIRTTLKSLEKQSYHNFEVILIDDGSCDKTYEIIQEYMQNSKLLMKCVRQKNQGVSVARNLGLQIAKGKYITFIDSDDVYHPCFIELLYRDMNRYNADIVLCQYQNHFFDNSNLHGMISSEMKSKKEMLDIYFHKRIHKVSFFNAIYKKSIIDQYEINFPIGIRYGEDSEFICKYLYHCNKGTVFMKKELYGYIPCDNSVMHMVDYRRTENILVFNNILEYWKDEYKTSIPIVEKAVWSCAKDFAMCDKELNEKFRKEYDVRTSMKKLIKSKEETPVRISALLYLIHPELFRKLIYIYGKL